MTDKKTRDTTRSLRAKLALVEAQRDAFRLEGDRTFAQLMFLHETAVRAQARLEALLGGMMPSLADVVCAVENRWQKMERDLAGPAGDGADTLAETASILKLLDEARKDRDAAFVKLGVAMAVVTNLPRCTVSGCSMPAAYNHLTGHRCHEHGSAGTGCRKLSYGDALIALLRDEEK